MMKIGWSHQNIKMLTHQQMVTQSLKFHKVKIDHFRPFAIYFNDRSTKHINHKEDGMWL